jgi:hypothetical protein
MPHAPLPEPDLQQALRQLGIDRHTVRAVVLLPLVQVAWADGRVQASERGLILEIATRYGLDEPEREVLTAWLSRQPTEHSFALARRVLLSLWMRDRQRGEAPASLEGVLRMCHCVARVAGGLFGLAFTVDRREQQLLVELSESLQLGPELSPAAQTALADEQTVLLRMPELAGAPPLPPATHPTLTPAPDRTEAGTVPLSSLRPTIADDADTELDLPVLPHPYDAVLADDD